MERRRSARLRRRLVIDYQIGPARCTGFTRDLASGGLFVFASRLPAPGSCVRAWLDLPEGRGRVEVWGRVVRCRPTVSALPGRLHGGFFLRVLEAAEDYLRFVPPRASSAAPPIVPDDAPLDALA